MDLALLVLDSAALEPPPSLRSLGRLDSTMPVLGLACVDSVFFMLLFDVTSIESTLSSHSFTCMGLFMLILNMMKVGSTSSLRSYLRLDLTVSVFGIN